MIFKNQITIQEIVNLGKLFGCKFNLLSHQGDYKYKKYIRLYILFSNAKVKSKSFSIGYLLFDKGVYTYRCMYSRGMRIDKGKLIIDKINMYLDCRTKENLSSDFSKLKLMAYVCKEGGDIMR